MFKYRLTHYYLCAWMRDCQAVQLPKVEKKALLRCSSQVQHYWNAFLSEAESGKKSARLFTALVYFKDCHEMLIKQKILTADSQDLWNHSEMVEKRLGDIFLSLADCENGQMRMLG